MAEKATADRLVVFQRDLFEDFCHQICKEQRENTLKSCKFSSDGNYYFATKDEIINSKMPGL